ncbi:MAG: hypothetical protein OTJ97_07385, partial [SAR202 cluster bacterium]|nr:hypothetical protein [SAR202 cluster bacterium]
MNRKSIAYSGILLLALILSSFVLNQDVVRGLTSNAHVGLATSGSTHLLGQEVVFVGSLTFASDETAKIERLRLKNTSGTQALDVELPIVDTGGSWVDLSSAVAGSLRVKVTFTNITASGSGTLPGTLPGTTLPSTGDFKGGSSGGSIAIVAAWTPPVFLDPVPNLTLIPSYDTYFALPTLSEPTDVSGTKLPASGYAWSGGAIPTAGVTAGTALPDSTSTAAVPQITLSTNAPASLPSIPNSTGYMGTGATSSAGFTIPSLTVVTSSAASFPSATDSFAIPSPTIATSSITAFGSGGDYVFTVPQTDGSTSTAQVIKGMAHDGTNFWFVLAGASNDVIVKVGGSHPYHYSTSTTAPSNSIDGIAAVGSSLYVVENEHRCW